MIQPPRQIEEQERLDALCSTPVCEHVDDSRLDSLTRIGCHYLSVPIACVTLVESDQVWLKSAQGIDQKVIERDQSFCAYTIHSDEAFVVEDAWEDERFPTTLWSPAPPLCVSTQHCHFMSRGGIASAPSVLSTRSPGAGMKQCGRN